jgi:hypothetical protein
MSDPTLPEATVSDEAPMPQVGESWANDNGDPPWQQALAETAYGEQLDDADNVPEPPPET